MTMITASECGKDISDKTDECICCAVLLLVTTLAITGMRIIFSFCIFVLAENFAQANQYCENIPINSAAYYSQESLSQEERFKQESELLPIISGFENAKKFLEAGECDQTQNVLNEIRTKIKYTKPYYSFDGSELTRDDIENAFVAIQSDVYSSCLNGPERDIKLLWYLEQEANSGNKVAQELFGKTKDMMRARMEKAAEKNKIVPRFADYGTDMASVQKYTSDISEASEDVCRDAWRKMSADAAYCLAQYESGDKKITMLREAAKLGNPIAQNNLAMLMEHSSTPGNSAEIVRMINASARSGIPHAQVTVGWWYRTGERGYKVNYAESMKWNLKAYKQGHSEGANNIGELYEKGLGVPKDIKKAKTWYKKSSVLGNTEATERLERLEQLER